MSDNFERTRVVLVRHGESNVTVQRVLGGFRTCSGLSPLGHEQAARLRDRLAETGEIAATALFSSQFPRAVETAEIIQPSLGVPIVHDARFGEHDPGPECDGMTFREFVDTYGMPDWHGDPHAETFPGGETLATFHHRVGEGLAEAVAMHRGGVIVVACHGGVVDAAFRYLLRLPQIGAFDLHTLNTSLTEFVESKPGRWQLVRYNDSAHLAGLPTETPREGEPL